MRTKTRASRKRRLRTVGMTLIEIMVVIIIMAMIAAAVGVAVIPQLTKAKIKQARTDAITVASAAGMYIAEGSSDDCPTMAELLSGNFLSGTQNTKDPWNHEFQIECSGPEPIVTSAGPDGDFGNEDDVKNTAPTTN